MLRYMAAFVVTLLSVSVPASANVGAQYLQTMCAKKDSPPEQMFCFAYIQGVMETYISADEIIEKSVIGGRVFSCLPKEVPESVVQAIIERYLADHPKDLQYSAVSEIGAALAEAYPCPKNSK